MKIYFLFDKEIKYHRTIKKITDVLNSTNIKIWKRETRDDDGTREKELIKNSQGYVVYATTFGSQIGYILAYLMLQKKPILCIFDSEDELEKLKALIPDTGSEQYITLRSLEKESDGKIVLDFLKSLKIHLDKFELPSLKFTLRITSKMQRYLEWKAKKENTSKANFLRIYLEEELMKKDKEYKEGRD